MASSGNEQTKLGLLALPAAYPGGFPASKAAAARANLIANDVFVTLIADLQTTVVILDELIILNESNLDAELILSESIRTA